MTLTTADNVALFHARAVRDYCKDHTNCKDCVFYQLVPDMCQLMMAHPNYWENIERRDLNNAVVD